MFARLVITGLTSRCWSTSRWTPRPNGRPTMSVAGPTLDPVDLARRKVVALFDRAEARDFIDVHALAARYGTDRLLELAAAVDAGFDVDVFADMLDSLSHFTDDEIPAPNGDATAVRAFVADWSAALREVRGQCW